MNLIEYNQSNFHWFFKYKLYHLPFWFLYHYAWWAITIGSVWEVANLIFFSHSAIKFSFYFIFQALGVYFNLYYLIPKFLEKTRYFQYVGWLTFTVIMTAAIITSGYYVSAYWTGRSFQDLWGIEPGNYLHFFKASALPSTVASSTLAMSIKLTKNWIQTKRRESMLEKANLATELKFLKSQFNPHFLFNTINSIFVLINKNPEVASESLAKFSDLLRHQLYECNEQEILFSKEVRYLHNFIELQKLRHDEANLQVTFDFTTSKETGLTIAPFILIPFVENGFKHISQWKDKPNWINLSMEIRNHQLHFQIINSINDEKAVSREFLNQGGIGLKNVERRLNLIYPDSHKLEIKQTNDRFQVDLHIALHKLKTGKVLTTLVEE